jgi:Flp pilus assembly protein TadG
MREAQSGCTRNHHGIVAVEFGLVLLFLVPLVIGVVEFGRALYAYDTLAKSVRSAARHLSVGETDGATTAGATRQLEAVCIVVTGSPVSSGSACSGSAQLPGLTTGMVTVLVPSNSGAVTNIATGTGTGTISLVTVSVQGYPLSGIAGILYSAITLGAISATVPFIFF